CTENQDPFARSGDFPNPVQPDAVQNDECRDKGKAEHEDSPAHQQTRENNVYQAQDQAAGSQSLSDRNQLRRASAERVGAVEIAVIETNLKRGHHRETLQHESGASDVALKLRWVAPEADSRRAQDSHYNEQLFQHHEK